MKLRKFAIENTRSFLEPAEFLLDGDISILIGPNGGGKTNLLDAVAAVLRQHLMRSWTSRHEGTPEAPQRRIYDAGSAPSSMTLSKHSRGNSRPQKITFEVEVTKRDIDNMQAMQNSALALGEFAAARKYENVPIGGALEWDVSAFAPGDRFAYSVVDGSFSTGGGMAAQFVQFLGLYEVDALLRQESDQAPLSTPLLYLPINRASGGFVSSVMLSSYREYDYKRNVDFATSRSGSAIAQLAVGRLATKYRMLLERDAGATRSEFPNDPQVKELTQVLKDLGYAWSLECVDPMTNRYDVMLTKQGTTFLADNASSGEKELLTYLFAVYALNVRDALIVVDEPEVHLHPKWQALVLSLFERLSRETGNQFLLATHSPVFVAPTSIQYVSRVYSEKQQSRIVRLNSASLPDARHLFAIVNSQNNERIFFADLVVLVEGMSDKLVFEKLLEWFSVEKAASVIIEIVSVGGKAQFKQYTKLLHAAQVPHVIIADLDYCFDIGTSEIVKLFDVDAKAIREKVVDDAGSLDGQALIERLDEAIVSKNLDDLSELWEYIKGRKRKLRTMLSATEQAELDTFVEEQRSKAIFILADGDLETYLPEGYRSKDLDKLVRLVNSPTFLEQLEREARRKLQDICEAIRLIAARTRAPESELTNA
jgi:putative ATP-dependent endonuclease of OLD family